MAGYNGVQVATATTTANTVDTVVLSGAGFSVKVTNLNGGPPIYWTASWPGGPCPVPTVGGPNCFAVASVIGNSINTRAGDFQFGSVIQLISSGITAYEVELQSVRATS